MHIYIPKALRCNEEVGSRSPIPAMLRKLTGRYFVACVVCGVRLPDRGVPVVRSRDGNPRTPPYFIVREIRANELYWEYAICLACQVGRRDEYSLESRERVAALFSERGGSQERFGPRDAGGVRNPLSMPVCRLTGACIGDSRVWRFVYLCQDHEILHSEFPCAISEEGLALVDECLSSESRAVDERFVATHLMDSGAE